MQFVNSFTAPYNEESADNIMFLLEKRIPTIMIN
jgi:hypothetical protein